MEARSPKYVAIVCALLSISIACNGDLSVEGEGVNEIGVPKTKTKTTQDGTQIKEVSSQIRRLTPLQFRNTVEAALGLNFVETDFPQFNDDIPTIGLSNDPNNLKLTDINVDSFYQSIGKIAQKSLANNSDISACLAAPSDVCFSEIVKTVGLALWRRPLSSEEIDDLLATAQKVGDESGTRSQQLEFLIQAMVASPNMLYRTEIGVLEDTQLILTDYEIASALSYSFWNAPPDSELLNLAAAGTLKSPENLSIQAQRLAKDPKFADAIAEFYIDYLKLDVIFSKEKVVELGMTPAVRLALFSGLRSDLVETFSKPDATLLDPFFSTAFSVNSDSASFFGIPVTSASFERVDLDPVERFGVLSHPNFLSVHSNSGSSGIVTRGVFTLEQLLCSHLGSPPPNVGPREDLPVGFDSTKETSREVLAVLHTSQPGCDSCHSVIDPAGFGFENYDSAGRYRTTEKDNLQIDSSGELSVKTETFKFDDSVGYVETISKSIALRQCVSRTFLAYILGGDPRKAEIDAFYEGFDENNGTLKTLADLIVATPSFTTRSSDTGGQ